MKNIIIAIMIISLFTGCQKNNGINKDDLKIDINGETYALDSDVQPFLKAAPNRG